MNELARALSGWENFYVTSDRRAAHLIDLQFVVITLIAGAAFRLRLIGIHNAWDTVTHIIASQVDGD